MAEPDTTRRSRFALAAFLLVAGSFHFAAPGAYERAVPGSLGPPRPWIYASGVAELVGGVLLTSSRTRRTGAWWAAVTFLLVFPANVKMALDGRITDSGLLSTPAAAWARLPLQVPLVWWAWRLTR